jgi:hypothetical protein
VLVYLVPFRKAVVATDYPIMIVAFAFFGLSVLADHVQSRVDLPGQAFGEDGAKLMGIVAWTVYFSRTAMKHVRLRAGEQALKSA